MGTDKSKPSPVDEQVDTPLDGPQQEEGQEGHVILALVDGLLRQEHDSVGVSGGGVQQQKAAEVAGRLEARLRQLQL